MGVIASLEKPYLPNPFPDKKEKHTNKHLIFPLTHYFSLCNLYCALNHMETEVLSLRAWKLPCKVKLFSPRM